MTVLIFIRFTGKGLSTNSLNICSHSIVLIIAVAALYLSIPEPSQQRLSPRRASYYLDISYLRLEWPLPIVGGASELCMVLVSNLSMSPLRAIHCSFLSYHRSGEIQ